MSRTVPIIGLVFVLALVGVIVWLVWARGNSLRDIAPMLQAAFWILLGLIPFFVRMAKEAQRSHRMKQKLERGGRNYEDIDPK